MKAFFNYNVVIDVLGIVIVVMIVVSGLRLGRRDTYTRLFAMMAGTCCWFFNRHSRWGWDGVVFAARASVLFLDSVYYAAQIVFFYSCFVTCIGTPLPCGCSQCAAALIPLIAKWS